MPRSQKPIVMICGSRSINDINLSRYIHPEHCGAIVSGGANGIDTLAENWAKANKIEFVLFPAQWDKFGKRAGMLRNEDMVHFSDVCICFWDGKSPGSLHAITYAAQQGLKTFLHIIEN